MNFVSFRSARHGTARHGTLVVARLMCPHSDAHFANLFRLHQHLLSGERGAGEQLAALVVPCLVSYLQAKHRSCDLEIQADAATDAMLEYLAEPRRYNPKDGESLLAQLRRAAWHDMLNGKQKERRRRARELIYSKVLAQAASEASRRIVELCHGHLPDAQVAPPGRLSAFQSFCASCDAVDQQILALMCEGERRTAEYSLVLGVQGKLLVEQRAVVHRAKKRLSALLARRGLLDMLRPS